MRNWTFVVFRLAVWRLGVLMVLTVGQAAYWFFTASVCSAARYNKLLIGSLTKISGEQLVPIEAMMELDFKTKAEIYQLRTQQVLKHPELVSTDYVPLEAVFGSITDGAPWWGLDGIYGFGNGPKSIKGASEETRMLCNPFILVGVIEPNAYIVSPTPLGPATAFYPKPLQLLWDSEHAIATITYDVSRHFMYRQKIQAVDWKDRTIHLVAYNARDFGFNYLCVDLVASDDVIPLGGAGTPVNIKQYIHHGGSCGYSNGCNNMSPDQPELMIKVPALPVTAFIKLWNALPRDCAQQADMRFLIKMR